MPSSYSRAPILELVQGPIPAHRFSILAEEMVIGRASDADISIVASELSRRHVLVKHNPATHAVSVQDLESKNGLFLNGIKVHMAVLHEGDRVQVGSAIFVFHEGGTG